MADISPEMWTAFGTWALVVGTLIAIWWQARQNHYITSANMVIDLGGTFDSSLMRSARKQLSTCLLGQRDPDLWADQVMGFFETLGFLTRRRILDKNMVWNDFSWMVLNYYAALTHPSNHIGRIRETYKDRTLYDQFEWLHNQLLRIDKKRKGVSAEFACPNADEVTIFLQEESKMDTAESQVQKGTKHSALPR